MSALRDHLCTKSVQLVEKWVRTPLSGLLTLVHVTLNNFNMNKQIRTLLAAFLLLGFTMACEQNDVDEIQLTDAQAEATTGSGAGGPSGGDPKGSED